MPTRVYTNKNNYSGHNMFKSLAIFTAIIMGVILYLGHRTHEVAKNIVAKHQQAFEEATQ